VSAVGERASPRDAVVFVAVDASSVPLFVRNVARGREEAHPVVADAAVRKARGVRWIRATAYDANGEVLEEWLRSYDERGRQLGERRLRATAWKLDTMAQAKKTLAARPLGYHFPPWSLRRKLVALCQKERSKRRCAIRTIAQELGIPGPTLTRWVNAVEGDRPPHPSRTNVRPKPKPKKPAKRPAAPGSVEEEIDEMDGGEAWMARWIAEHGGPDDLIRPTDTIDLMPEAARGRGKSASGRAGKRSRKKPGVVAPPDLPR
jgi:hypothetical protein